MLAASFVLLTLIAGLIGTAWGLVRADRAWRAEATQRRIAVDEKTKAEESEKLAMQQRGRAEAREEQAIDAVKKFRDAVANNPELKNNPALDSLRKTLLKEPLAFFRRLKDQLQDARETTPESLERLASAAFDLGELTAEIGDKQDALQAFAEAVAIRERLAKEDPSDTRLQVRLAESHNSKGHLERETGGFPEALASYERARVIRERLAQQDPRSTEFRRSLAASYNNIAILQNGYAPTGRGDGLARAGPRDPGAAGARESVRDRVPVRPGKKLWKHRRLSRAGWAGPRRRWRRSRRPARSGSGWCARSRQTPNCRFSCSLASRPSAIFNLGPVSFRRRWYPASKRSRSWSGLGRRTRRPRISSGDWPADTATSDT